LAVIRPLPQNQIGSKADFLQELFLSVDALQEAFIPRFLKLTNRRAVYYILYGQKKI